MDSNLFLRILCLSAETLSALFKYQGSESNALKLSLTRPMLQQGFFRNWKMSYNVFHENINMQKYCGYDELARGMSFSLSSPSSFEFGNHSLT